VKEVGGRLGHAVLQSNEERDAGGAVSVTACASVPPHSRQRNARRLGARPLSCPIPTMEDVAGCRVASALPRVTVSPFFRRDSARQVRLGLEAFLQ
jgi:hypothetical protein